mmetsp:Transcript_32960/g.84464  ORF Transcript_32960/g.84464 Transcript_32960/m.84464 type:complete len:328 (-) Transcript_32960:324-1307(-)
MLQANHLREGAVALPVRHAHDDGLLWLHAPQVRKARDAVAADGAVEPPRAVALGAVALDGDRGDVLAAHKFGGLARGGGGHVHEAVLGVRALIAYQDVGTPPILKELGAHVVLALAEKLVGAPRAGAVKAAIVDCHLAVDKEARAVVAGCAQLVAARHVDVQDAGEGGGHAVKSPGLADKVRQLAVAVKLHKLGRFGLVGVETVRLGEVAHLGRAVGIEVPPGAPTRPAQALGLCDFAHAREACRGHRDQHVLRVGPSVGDRLKGAAPVLKEDDIDRVVAPAEVLVAASCARRMQPGGLGNDVPVHENVRAVVGAGAEGVEAGPLHI